MPILCAADENDPNAGVRIVHAPPDVNVDQLRGHNDQ